MSGLSFDSYIAIWAKCKNSGLNFFVQQPASNIICTLTALYNYTYYFFTEVDNSFIFLTVLKLSCVSYTLGVATAFAARDVLGNILSGFSLQFSKPFSVNDYIKVPSYLFDVFLFDTC